MKKNQLALIFLTLVVMLAVWYIKAPLGSDQTTTPDEDIVTTSGRLETMANLREAVRDERALMVAELDAVIASADTSIAEKDAALIKKQSLSDLTEKEILVEVQIKGLGYADAFVHSTTAGVEVIVVAEEESASNAVDIIQNVMVSFSDAADVIVNFKSASELSNN